jgi:two-component system phosphate regulon response regulator PhoB
MDSPGRRILVIDDDPVIVQLLVVNFEMDDYLVTSSTDPEVGLQMAMDDPPDIVLLDVMMPATDGLEVARRLRAEPATAEVPIVLLSAKAQYSDVQAGEELADSYITKPFDPLALLERVAELLAKPR